MEVRFFTNLDANEPAYHAVLPVVPRIGDIVILPGIPSARASFKVRHVSWDFAANPPYIAVQLVPFP